MTKAIVTGIALLAFGVTMGSAAASGVHTLSVAEQQTVREALLEQLKDPDSARFKDFVAVTKSGDTETVCGLVNARNSYGGYSGFAPFYGLLMKAKAKSGAKVPFFWIGKIGGTAADTSIVVDMCAKDGISIL